MLGREVRKWEWRWLGAVYFYQNQMFVPELRAQSRKTICQMGER